ncbi:histidinol dehydrogenase [Candidatus Magnetomonas plexicatena]|uniref:histidinol dehydrogenase n=1 Tax=Candidatus Magnetomonas plexicatena TaxID=2552947 RepID=UPI001C7567C1|nr:histidinol dehydrogenase [Nitrospirales bacterium LBB_01]
MREIYTKNEFKAFREILRRRALGTNSDLAGEGNPLQGTVSEIIKNIRDRGDSALRQYTQQFDKVELNELRIPESVIEQSAQTVEPKIVKALKLSMERIRRFHKRQLEKSWRYSYKGAELGQLIRPLERVGVYVPGGKASYPSTVLMNVIPAQTAGVKEIALCVPTPQGELNPYVMRAIWELGITEVYPVGGAQAVAAMAYGTESIKKVDKITGPGNMYVAEAKKQVFGVVDIDMIAGPSEILIVSDDSGDPEFIAADLLSQAEHDEMASSVLITTSKTMLASVKKMLKSKLEMLQRENIAQISLNNFGAMVYAESIEQAFEYSNEIAPEHLEIMVENPDECVSLVKNAGAVFIGNYSTEPLGDYCAGPNHTLPTNGTSRFFSPLGVYDFIKRTSYINFSEAGFLNIADAVFDLASCEGLHGHADSVMVRLKRLKGKQQ